MLDPVNRQLSSKTQIKGIGVARKSRKRGWIYFLVSLLERLYPTKPMPFLGLYSLRALTDTLCQRVTQRYKPFWTGMATDI